MKKREPKPNYRAERKAASDFADAAMDGRALPQREWLQLWGVIYEARLAQIRGGGPLSIRIPSRE